MRMTRLALDRLPQCRRHLTRAPPRSSANYANGDRQKSHDVAQGTGRGRIKTKG